MLYAAVAALVIGLGLQPLVVRLMMATAVLDIPSDRSSHTVPTPRGGGIAVVAAALVGLLFLPAARQLALPMLLCGIIGLVEDVRGVPILPRFVSQLLAGAATGLLLVPNGVPAPVGVGIIATIALWITAFVNAFNFMDGINGISAMYTTVAGIAYAVLGVRHNLPVLTGAGTVVAAAALTFLPWNVGRARIFLGDVGSYGLGGALGTLAAYGVLHSVPVGAALAPLVVYLADTGWTLLRRIWRRETWYRPHRTHVYQRLTDFAWSQQRIALTVACVAGVVSLCAFAAVGRGPLPQTAWGLLAAGVIVTYLAAPDWLAWHHRRLIGPDEEDRVTVHV